MSSTCSLIDLYALCLYKFVGYGLVLWFIRRLTVNELVRCLLNKYCYYIVFLYTGACMMIFMVYIGSISVIYIVEIDQQHVLAQDGE